MPLRIVMLMILMLSAADLADVQAPKPDRDPVDAKLLERLRQQAGDLEDEVAAKREQLRVVKAQLELLKASPQTMDAAIAAFRGDPGQPVTIEVVVGNEEWLGYGYRGSMSDQVSISVTGDAMPASTPAGRITLVLNVLNEERVNLARLQKHPRPSEHELRKAVLNVHPLVEQAADGPALKRSARKSDFQKCVEGLRGKRIRVHGILVAEPANVDANGTRDFVLKVDGMEQVLVRD